MKMMMMMIYDFQQNFMEPEVVVYIAVRNYSIFVSGVFKISEGGAGGDAPMWWSAGEGSGERAVPPPQKKKSRHSRSLETIPLSRACVLTLNNTVTLKFGSAIHLKCSKDSFSWYNQ